MFIRNKYFLSFFNKLKEENANIIDFFFKYDSEGINNYFFRQINAIKKCNVYFYKINMRIYQNIVELFEKNVVICSLNHITLYQNPVHTKLNLIIFNSYKLFQPSNSCIISNLIYAFSKN